MPFLWKKSDIAQLTGLVSDIRSRRRRSSLLVQTGFPTSLADLVVKNRTRLKKSSSSSSPPKKKKIEREDSSPIASPRSVISSFSEAPVAGFPLKDSARFESRQSELSCSGSDEVRDVVAVSASRRYFSLIIKLFFVVVLALGTKKIAVGITASAFLLFFIEFVGKRLSFCSRDSAGGLDLNQVDVIRVNQSDLSSSDCERRLSLDLVEDEQTRDREAFGDNEIQAIESGLDLSKGQRRLECPERELKSEILAVGDDGDLIQVKKRRNRKLGSSIFKKKFLNKFVPKKFRGSKNGKVSEEGKLDPTSEVSESIKGGVEEDTQEAKDEKISSSVASNNTSLVNLEEIGLTRKNARREIKWNSGHLVSFVIVLVGLAGGRIMALLLTIAWLLLLKSVQAAWRNLRNKKNL